MNILYLAHRIPYPPNKGDKIRSFHQIRHLSKRHAVHVACLVDDPADLEHVADLRNYCASVDAVYRDRKAARLHAFKALVLNKPLSVGAFYSKELKRRIDRKLRAERCDRILVFSSSMAEYVRDVKGIPRIMDFVDVDSDKWRLYAEHRSFPVSWIYRLEARRLSSYEEDVARAFDQSVFVTEKEAELFRERVKDRPVAAILNGVDLEYFSPGVSQLVRPSEPAIVFTGVMDYYPNVDAVSYFCDSVLPMVLESCQDAMLYIVGRNPSSQVQQLGERRNVIVTGAVPDVRPYLSKACVSVAPFRIARGVQNKVLEAMAMGVPVVGTGNAFQGLQATVSDGIRIADAPESFAKEVVGLMNNAELRRHCSVKARQYVEREHRWEDQNARLESLLQCP